MDGKIPITKNGLENLKAELQRLLSKDRPLVKKAISEALEHGDLRENAEFHAAKEQQGFIEGRIQEISGKLSRFHVVDPSTQSSDVITFGATVALQNLDTEEELEYQIVGMDESNLEENKISYQSPIAKALIGKEEGDVVTVAIPRGTIEVEITKVQYI